MNPNHSKIRIAIADDHVLLRNALAALINTFENCTVIIEARTGNELISMLESGLTPDLILLDLNMPDLDGFETAKWLQTNRPQIHVLMLTMYDTAETTIRLLQVGVKGFLKKDTTPSELRLAINSIMHSGSYYSNTTSARLVSLFRKNTEQAVLTDSILSDQELKFLKYACTGLTYKEIANEMKLNVRTIDNMRDNLFTKLDVKSRVELAMYSIKHGIQTF